MAIENYSRARAHLAALMNQVVQDAEEVRITRRGKPDVVLISAAELDGLRETAYLLRSPPNAEKLTRALARSAEGQGVQVSSEALHAIRREVAELGDRPGGTSPTLERLARVGDGGAR